MNTRRLILASLVSASLLAGCADVDAPVAQNVDALTSSELPGASVVRHFFPNRVWMHNNDNCPAPAGPGSTGRALYSVRSHPGNRNVALVAYTLLFRRDCGSLVGLTAHDGDAENFYATLRRDSRCANGWAIHAIQTVAHTGTLPGEVNERIIDSCNAPGEILVSRNKHALYHNTSQCTLRGDTCSEGYRASFDLVNAGTRTSQLVDDLGPHGFANERVWTGDDYFCGGISNNDRSDCGTRPGVGLARSSDLPDADRRKITVKNEAGAVIRVRYRRDGEIGSWNQITAPLSESVTLDDDVDATVDVEILVSEYLFDGFHWEPVVRGLRLDRSKQTRLTVTGTVWDYDYSVSRSSNTVSVTSAEALCVARHGAGTTAQLALPNGTPGAGWNYFCNAGGQLWPLDLHAGCRAVHDAPELWASVAIDNLASPILCYRPF
ncbi:MAG: hypothetical protein JNK05_28385 [Myxococcales bacterium]|nr:hypothetical protein [Myxococcales bacterium]